MAIPRVDVVVATEEERPNLKSDTSDLLRYLVLKFPYAKISTENGCKNHVKKLPLLSLCASVVRAQRLLGNAFLSLRQVMWVCYP